MASRPIEQTSAQYRDEVGASFILLREVLFLHLSEQKQLLSTMMTARSDDHLLTPLPIRTLRVVTYEFPYGPKVRVLPREVDSPTTRELLRVLTSLYGEPKQTGPSK